MFGNEYVISFQNLLGMWLLIYDCYSGVKVTKHIIFHETCLVLLWSYNWFLVNSYDPFAHFLQAFSLPYISPQQNKREHEPYAPFMEYNHI